MLTSRRFALPLALAATLLASATASASVPAGQPCSGRVLARALVAPIGPTGVRVCSAAALAATLNSSYSGRIIVPQGSIWDMSSYENLPVKSGVQIIGERGSLGSRPLLYTRNTSIEYSLFKVTGNDVRINGLHLVGPKPASTHATHVPYDNAISITEDYDAQTGRPILVDDNEIERWSCGAVNVMGSHNIPDPNKWDRSWIKPGPGDAALVVVRGNDLHDNVMDGGGYGVVVGGGSYVTVQDNVFDNNRHSVAASGNANSGYIARFNYVLNGGTEQGHFYNQHFDVHGTGDDHYGGNAGTYFEIGFNTILGDQTYYWGFRTRPALMLRGRPTMGMYFHDNVVIHGDQGDALSLKGISTPPSGLFGAPPANSNPYNIHTSGNSYDTDDSQDIASGDFDGDGQTDILVTNGTGWWYSKAGLTAWQPLHESTKLVSQLAFADIDNDGRTDALYRDANGNLGYLPGATGNLIALTTLPVPIGQLHFGDFDGDGRTDMFYTRGGQWYVWYAATRTWTKTQTSGAADNELLFGNFDGVPGTDVAAVMNGQWSISSGSTGPWTRLNAKLSSSFSGAVAADFDGDGKTDIAFTTSSGWVYSSGGTAPLKTMRTGSNLPSLRSLQIGHFNRGPRVQVVGFSGYQLAAWNGIGTSNGFFTRALQDMR